MKNEFAGVHGFDRIAAAITEQLLHDLNLKRQETTRRLKGKFLAQKC